MIRRDIIVSRKSLRLERPTREQQVCVASPEITPKTARCCTSGRGQQSRSAVVLGLTATTVATSGCMQGMQGLMVSSASEHREHSNVYTHSMPELL